MAYWSLPDEVDTHQLIDRLMDRGVIVVLPRVTGKGTMELRRFLGTTSLTPGAFGIMEPTGPLFTDYDAIDAVVVPGMAFTADGRRLGRGGGYYDRLLPQLRHARRIGVAFPFQLVADIPEENHDATVDQVVCQRDNEK
jgi:5,10-methenyltetrahydrofolate synthetase